ncbi:Transposase IS200 like protein [Enhygromyxa salina]|uniref:Transposase IS200 like protein n=1 Tax=Enhygromyxa salina TaxID=215803 RepID=A0A2S9XES8_9BACT|nr:transposase [Enhygromyxa salina]PRP91376.1 Transposase IS200 like protein [Enhygromyxa salina]
MTFGRGIILPQRKLQSSVGAAENPPVTPPRCIHEEQTVFITCRAVGRSFRFVPTEKVTQTLLFVLAYTSTKFDVSIHEVVYMSNHFHVLMTAHTKCIPDFMEHLNSLASRALNALRGISGTNIEKGYGLVEPQDPKKVLEHAVYTLTNPCSSDLVLKARHWKGVTTVGMRYGDELVVRKPEYGIWGQKKKSSKKSAKKRKRRDARTPSKRDRSKIPKTATLRLVRPKVRPELSDDELRDLVLERVTARENDLERVRQRAGKKILKMRVVRAQHWAAMPGAEDLFGVRPTVSSTDKWKRIAALQRKKVFEEAHAEARQRWLGGERDVVFPFGTWLMCRRYAAQCAASLCC